MHILYTGPISLDILTEALPLGRKLHDACFRFDLGAHEVLGFHKAGHRVTVLKLTDLVNAPQVLKCDGFEIRLFPDRPVSQQYRHFYHKEVKVLSEAIKDSRPDVVFANWPYQFARAALVSGFPTLVVAHDSPWRILWMMRDKARLLRAVYSQIMVFPKVKYLSAVSPYIVDDVRRLNFYNRKVRCIPNAVCDMAAVIKAEDVTIRKNAKVIVSVSEWNPRKNPKTLLFAWPSLKKLHEDWKLIVFGRGMGWNDAAGEFVRGEGILEDGLDLRGYCSRDVIDECLAKEADLFVSTTLEESFGLIFIEAMAKGIPCVGGAKSGAVPWVLGIGEDDDAGVVCNVRDAADTALCIERLMGDYELRRRLSSNGIARVRNKFSLDACVQGYLDALECVANGGEGR